MKVFEKKMWEHIHRFVFMKNLEISLFFNLKKEKNTERREAETNKITLTPYSYIKRVCV